ncbi:putative glycosyl [Golovinomyces cichoracearum]|uniref:Putative glycosyl n=1 Tax=Golovinomyces cichoracearum TaxID=62708 RepID=A0A420J8Y8_9PEZI|nr:putative glycosyl [Golovinomyces cichoracearum]
MLTNSQSQSQSQPVFQQAYQRSDEEKKSYALVNLSKIFKDNQRYGGSPDEFFDDKFATFTENCKTAGLPVTRYHEAFHIMLEGAALQHYREIVRQNKETIPSVATLVTSIKEFFEGKEHESMLRNQWDETTLFSILAEQPENGKDVDKALTTLVQRLRHLQQGLSPPYRTEEIFYGKLSDSCKGHPATNIACSTTPRGDTSVDFINRAKSNISTWKKSQLLAKQPQFQQFFEDDSEEYCFYTDRRFQGRSGKQQKRHNYNNQNNHQQSNKGYATRSRFCYKARNRLKDAYHRQNSTYISDTEFDKRFDAFVSEMETSNLDDEFIEQFKAFTIEDNHNTEHVLLTAEDMHQL